MIFVTVGTEKFQFDRLIREVDALVWNKKINDKVFIQLGSCKHKPEHCEWKHFLSFGEMCRKIKEADLVISHAGSTLLLCSQYGKIPILVPRKKEFHEHVDNHQVAFAKEMQELGYARTVFDIRDLANFIHMHEKTKTSKIISKSGPLKLTEYLKDLLTFWEKQ